MPSKHLEASSIAPIKFGSLVEMNLLFFSIFKGLNVELTRGKKNKR